MTFLYFIFLVFLNFKISLADAHLSDEDFYDKGVKHYDEGNFDESFVVFFNLAEKGNRDAIFNLSNMYYEGIGTVQDFNSSLKYSWLCALNGNQKCIKKIDVLKEKLSEENFLNVSKIIPEMLEDEYKSKDSPLSAFKLGYWFEKLSPEIDFEKSYLWYSVSVSAGVYKAMKFRDRVAGVVEKEKIIELQNEAVKIYNKDKYFKEGI